MTPREAGIQAFYADEGTSNTLQGLNAAFDAYEAAGLAEDSGLVRDLMLLMESYAAYAGDAVPYSLITRSQDLHRRLATLSKAKEA